MGIKYFGIDDSMNNKDEICKIIRDKLNDEKFSMIKQENFQDDEMYTNLDDDTFDLFNKIQNIKSYKKKTVKRSNKFKKSSSSSYNKTKKRF